MTAHPLQAGRAHRGAAPAQGGSGRRGLVHDVRVARQGVYDRARRLVAYEVLVRGPGIEEASEAEGERATSKLVAATFATFGLETISDGKPVLITFTRSFLTGVLPVPVPSENVVIEVTDRIGVDHELLLGLAQLKQAGYRIAVDNYRGDLGRSVLLELADIVAIDVNALPTLVVPGIVQSCRLTGATLLARDVSDAETLQRCVDLGFELFQGEHLSRPGVLHRRVLAPSQLVCVRLLNELSDPDIPVHRIEHLVGSDPGLSMRLLRSAHSAAGTGQEVESLRQALVLIGPRLLRSWLVLTLLEGTANPNTTDELWSVLARAHACQHLAPTEGDLAYTIGLLSGAAQLLGVDAAAVADGEGAAGRALRAVEAHERNDEAALAVTGLPLAEVSGAYLDALQEALRQVHEFLGA